MQAGAGPLAEGMEKRKGLTVFKIGTKMCVCWMLRWEQDVEVSRKGCK
jgi:hypothetical protein